MFVCIHVYFVMLKASPVLSHLRVVVGDKCRNKM